MACGALLFLILCVTFSGRAIGAQWPTLVKIDNGSVQGFSQGSTNYFLGIPYAVPPVGDLRWAPPKRYFVNSALDATKFSPVCTQEINDGIKKDYTFPPNVTASEDCLTINIWAPAQSEGLNPVMFWIHGGGLVQGGNAEYRERGQNMSKIGNVVVVFFNYRLGVLGYLSHPLFPSPGNFGYLDQRLALEWVRDTISKFGGNPNQVTIFGESAGGSSVGYHMVAPLSKQLFQRAIMESGAPFNEVQSLTEGNAIGVQFANSVGCTSNNILQCLRSLPAEKILAQQTKQNFDAKGTVDGKDLVEHPYKTVTKNSDKLTHVTFISGNVLNEGTFFVGQYPSPMSNSLYISAVQNLYGKFGSDVLQMYPCGAYNASDCRVALAFVVGDFDLVCPGVIYANALSNLGVPVYGYVFEHEPYYANHSSNGVFHSSEIEFVFSTLSSFRPYIPPEEVFSNQVTAYWTSFGRTGDPNTKGLYTWHPYTSPLFQRISLDLSPTTSTLYAQKQCQFWQAFYDDIYNY